MRKPSRAQRAKLNKIANSALKDSFEARAQLQKPKVQWAQYASCRLDWRATCPRSSLQDEGMLSLTSTNPATYLTRPNR